jgi:hypothetical protein
MESTLDTKLAEVDVLRRVVRCSGKFENMYAVDIQQSLFLLYEYGFNDFP